MWLTPGAILAAVAWPGLGFGIYARTIGRRGVTYAPLVAVAVLRTWTYLSSYALLLGAKLNFELEHQAAVDSTRGGPKPLVRAAHGSHRRRRMMQRINRTLEWLWSRGIASRPSLLAADIMSKAQARTGVAAESLLPGWLHRLELLTNDLETHASLTALGRTIAHGQLVSAATNMLRFEKIWRTHPEIDEVPMARPILIVGQMRSGTTRMQRLLACDDRFRFTRFYESWNPLPRSPVPAFDDRPWRARAALFIARSINRKFDAIHPTGACAPDEEIGLFNILMHSAAYEAQWHVPYFVAHCEAMDARPLYKSFARMMRTIGWFRRRKDDRPWIMKVPQFTQDVGAVLATFPGARVVRLRRDDRDVLSSSVRLVVNQRAVQSEVADVSLIQEEWRRKIALRARRTQDALAQLGPPQVEIRFADMDADWEREMERVYHMLDLPLTNRTREAMRRYVARAKSNRLYESPKACGTPRRRESGFPESGIIAADR